MSYLGKEFNLKIPDRWDKMVSKIQKPYVADYPKLTGQETHFHDNLHVFRIKAGNNCG